MGKGKVEVAYDAMVEPTICLRINLAILERRFTFQAITLFCTFQLNNAIP